ncbi:polyprotein [Rhynchospora pubera]|uniref:Polyprotein n=1 Tax=Rhynchospora pubera TaxID=906938 RepID=A0AAV8DM67_9POAL|nr:polyprotein [Rhynchospora pubera]
MVMDYHTAQFLLQAKASSGLYLLTASLNCAPQACLGEKVTANTWHFRLGHPALPLTKRLLIACNLPCSNSVLSLCEDCSMAKCNKLPFSTSCSSTKAPLELIHADVWGPAPVLSSNGFRYFVLFIDDFSRFTWIFFLASKDEVAKVFSNFKIQVENLIGRNIKILRTDGGTEFKPISRLFPQIVHQLTCPHTPEQNGVSERKNRHILELSLAIINHGCIPLVLWDEIFASTVFLINRLPPSANASIVSPFELLFSKKPDYLQLKVLGCQCFPLTRPYNQHKLQPHSTPCVFIGYALSQKGYRCYQPQTDRVFVSRHVIFHEQVFPFRQNKLHVDTSHPADYTLWVPASMRFGPNLFPSRSNTVGPSSSSSSASLPQSPANGPPNGPVDELPDESLEITIGQLARNLQRSKNSNAPDRTPARSSLPSSSSNPPDSTTSAHHMTTRMRDQTRLRRQFPDFVAFLATTPPTSDPTTFNQANKIPHWQDAMRSELKALDQNKTWVLVPAPTNHNVVGCKWIFKTKRKADGSIERYKARLVAQGFTQEEGVDYFDTFSPVIRPTTIRIVLSLALSHHWPIRQLDVNNAFLNGDLLETVYMRQPPGFVNPQLPSHVCLLKKAIYGLKQSPRAWFQTLSASLLQMGFHSSKFDPSLFILNNKGKIVVILIYVDDIIITGSDMGCIASVVHNLQSRFPLKDLGALHFFLGIAVSSSPNELHLSQKQYISELLCRTHMHLAQPVATPMAVNTSISQFDGDPFHDPRLYIAVVGALQYVTITRPDITFPVNKCSQFMHNPTTTHWSAVKRILRYLRGTIDHGLLFKASNSLNLHAYSDSDWAGCPDDRRSTSAFCVYLGNNIISWSSKKQPTVAKSSTEAEYRSLALAGAEVIWIQHILQELYQHLSQPPVLWCDNIGASYLASNPMYHARTKHVEIDFHFIREKVVAGQLLVKFISSRDQIADGLTKGLTSARFLSIKNKLMVCPVPSACGGAIR